jgi:uncharacterized protein
MNRIVFGLVVLAAILFGRAAQSAPLDDAHAAYIRGDFSAALTLLQPLADQGNAEAQYYVGSMYATGRGLPQSYAEAARWIRRSAEQGFAQAQYELGVMYRDGLGVARDDAETVRWYRRAAEQGFIYAQYNLGLRYASGQGITRDDVAAAEWFRKAAMRGDAGSQYHLALMCAEGRGVPKNLVEAYKWISLAAQNVQGSDRTQALERRDQIAKMMTSAQIDEALQLAREWTPTGSEAAPYRVFGYISVGTGEGSPVVGGQRVDVGPYVVSAPLGDSWKMWMDQSNGMVLFIRSIPAGGFTSISVGKRPLNPGMENKTEDEVVEAIQRFEEMNLKARGALRSYNPKEMRKETTIAGDMHLHLMTYAVTDHSHSVPVETKEAEYIYVPPNFKEARQIYFFGIAQTQKVGEAVFLTDLTGILPVIGSFQIKQ